MSRLEKLHRVYNLPFQGQHLAILPRKNVKEGRTPKHRYGFIRTADLLGLAVRLTDELQKRVDERVGVHIEQFGGLVSLGFDLTGGDTTPLLIIEKVGKIVDMKQLNKPAKPPKPMKLAVGKAGKAKKLKKKK